MKRIAKFEKVSLEQFREGWTDTFGPADEGVIEEIYRDIRLPKRATSGSAGYDFFAPARFVAGTRRDSEDSYGNPCLDGARVGAEMLSQKRTGIQVPSAA